MSGLGPWELILILIVVIFIYGGKRLSQLGENMGKGISGFKKSVRNSPLSTADEQKRLSGEKEILKR
ncbi:MAG: twin-arginine translocase TatA/TatE family subunit [Syntrophobacteraceae bacterium]